MISAILKSSLFRSAGVYTLTNVINTSIPFLMLPIFTRYLSPLDYGIVATFQVLIGFVSPFISLGMSGAISVRYYDKQGVDLASYVTSSLATLAMSTTIFGVLAFLFRSSISSISSFPEPWIWSIVVFGASQYFIDAALALWQVQVKPVPYGIFQIAQSIANVCLSIWLVVLLHQGWQGRLTAQLSVIILFGLAGLLNLWRNGWISRHVSGAYIKDLLRFGVPLIPHMFGGWIIAATDRIFINNMASVSETGMYAVAYQITMVITFIQTSFNLAWVPWLYDKLSQNDVNVNRKIIKFTYGYVLTNIGIALLISIAAPSLFGLVIGEKFSGSERFISWLAASRAVMAMYYMTCNYIFYAKKTVYISLATSLSACVHVVSLYVLIKFNGTIGAAQTSVISSVILVSLVWYFAYRSHPMPWLFWRTPSR